MNKDFFENKIHGRIDFPYIVYMGKIPGFLRYFPFHWHEEMEIICVEEGSLVIRVLSETYECSKGDIVVIPPNCIHDIRQKGSEEALYFNILFKLSLLEPDENSVCYKKYFEQFCDLQNQFSLILKNGSEINQKVTPHVRYLIDNRHKKYETEELLIKGNLYFLMNNLQEAVGNVNLVKGRSSHQFHQIKPLLKYLSENFKDEISIKNASNLCLMSESYFMKFFKKLTGMTFVNYLNQVRLEKAELMLRTSDLTELEISEACGFNNFSYFIRTFRRFAGKTPGQYRKMFQN